MYFREAWLSRKFLYFFWKTISLRDVCLVIKASNHDWLRPWSNESNISQSSVKLRSSLLCLARCYSAQCGQTSPTFRPIFLEFLELLRCALQNQCIRCIEFETLTPNENLKQKKCSIALPTFLIAIKQHRIPSSSTEHSTTSGQTPTFHRARMLYAAR